MKRLIVTADDFGLTERINQAIAFACREGIVTTASLMVTSKAFESAVDIARREPKLNIGLHLNLTEGTAAAYKHPVQLALALYRGKVRAADLEREIRGQIEKALDAGVDITHIDGHKHVHAIPAVMGILSRVAPGYGILAIRIPRETVPRLGLMISRNGAAWQQIMKQYAFGKVLAAAAFVGRTPLFIAPKRFYGVTQTGFLDATAFADVVHSLDDGIHELMCHPGYVDDDLKKTPTRLLAQRERELELLTGPDVRRVLAEAGVQLASYRDLVGNHGNRKRDPLLHRYSAL